MKIPKAVDFSDLKFKKVFDNSTKEYKTLDSMNEDGEWKDYTNEMLQRGVSVIFDASGDFFVVKPVAFKENNNRMKSNQAKKLGLQDFNFLNESSGFLDNNEFASELGSIEEDTSVNGLSLPKNPSTDVLKEDEYPWDDCIQDQTKKYGKEGAKKVCGSIKAKNESKNLKSKLKEDQNKFLLYDEDENEEQDGPEVLPGKDIDIESPATDLIHLDDEDCQVAPTQTPNKQMGGAKPGATVATQGITMQDIQALVQQIIKGSSVSTPQNVADPLANGEVASVSHDLTTGQNVLETEFPENQAKLDIVENKIETEESYLDILNGGGSPNTPVPQQAGEEFDIWENPAIESSDETEVIEEADVLNQNEYEDGDDELIDTPSAPVQNGMFNSGGQKIKIQITGWLTTITEPEVASLVESVRKNKGKLRKLESNNNKELFLYIESNSKIYKIKYEDKSKAQSSRPWSIKTHKFASLNEAVTAITKKTIVSDSNRIFKSLVSDNKDLVSRGTTNLKESNIFEDFRNDKNSINYVAGWNVKPVGALDLKRGLNEVYSNITQHTKDKNTLFKTKEGNYYLIKGNLGEASIKGTKRQIVDLENKRDYGVGQVIGLYENTFKGMGQIMYKIKRTSIPLLVWKNK